MDVRPWVFLVLLLFAVPMSALGQPEEEDAGVATVIPPDLRPWVPWVLRDTPEQDCPRTWGRDETICLWPTWLDLEIDDQGARFAFGGLATAPGLVTLPGGAGQWPTGVTLGGVPVSVLDQNGRPTVPLDQPGVFDVRGRIAWARLPESLALPAVGRLSVSRDGETVEPRRAEDGGLWLRGGEQAQAAGQADALELNVYRRFEDSVPHRLETRLRLEVTGRVREAVLPPVLPEAFRPLTVDSQLPARLETDGRLRVQVRPGTWMVTVHAVATQPLDSLAIAATPAPWPEAEIWAFQASPALRLVELGGAPTVDAAQTSVPPDWWHLPLYRLTADSPLTVTERQRGDANPQPDRITLDRSLWLDFDGRGFTVRDAFDGQFHSGGRLTVNPPLEPGRIAVNGDDQFITRLEEDSGAGVELRLGQASIVAESRLPLPPTGDLPAVGWSTTPERLSWSVNLPPAWRLLTAQGAQSVSGAWLHAWSLLDLFLVLFIALAAQRVLGWGWGTVALLGAALAYPENDSPVVLWLPAVALLAMGRGLAEGRLQRLINVTRAAVMLILVVGVVAFAVTQVRMALYPQLEFGGYTPSPADVAGGYAPQKEAGPSVPMLSRDMATIASAPQAPPPPAPRELPAYDPEARIQTGPGVPDWSWSTVRLGWQGPVTADTHVRLWLSPPPLTRALRVVAVILVVLLSLRLIRDTPWRHWRLGAAGGLLLATGTAAAEMPDPALLEALREHLTKPPLCAPYCAGVEVLTITVDGDTLTLNLTVLAQSRVGIPLPVDDRGLRNLRVHIGNDPAAALARDNAGQLWLAVPAGRHRVTIDAHIPTAVGRVDIPRPMSGGLLTLDIEGWSVDGADEPGVLQLTRAAPVEEQAGSGLEPADLPPLVRVDRHLNLGVDWRVDSTARRLGDSNRALTLRIPLLTGERITTAGLETADGEAIVRFAAGQAVASWVSILPRVDRLDLVASDRDELTETWRLDAASLWHVEHEGLVPVFRLDGNRWTPQWQPWPGERLSLHITRPQGVDGAVFTIDSADLDMTPGDTLLDATLALAVRASRGIDHSLTLPADSEVQSLTVNGERRPVDVQGTRLRLRLEPATRQVVLNWRQPLTGYRTPALDLGTSAVNTRISLNVPHDRWVLAVGGPQLGPAVLIWGVLVVIAGVAVGLGVSRLTPLGIVAWFLLGVGLSQVSLWAAVPVVLWLLALAHRDRTAPSTGTWWWFDLKQIGLGVLTVIALIALTAAVAQGLLGGPDMQINGNGSYANHLRWYQDRVDGTLPAAWAVTAPLWLYRVLMLLWALWLAFALLGWLRWGWQVFGKGGLWRSRPGRRDNPAANPAPLAE